MDADSGAVAERQEPPTGPPAEPRQRWRIAFSRRPGAPQVTHRELADEWLARLSTSGLPFPRTEGPKPRSPLTFAAPLPVGMAAEHEIADLVLADRRPVSEVRQAVLATMPDGTDLVDLFDVWLGSAPLAACAAAADYRVRLVPSIADDDLASAARSLLAAEALPRRRTRGTSEVDYDLRPLLDDIDVGEDCLRIRTRFDPARGAGRPEEVIAALEEAADHPLEVTEIVRERVILVEELAARPGRRG